MSEAPGILTPAYYERLDLLERRHWWCRSVRRAALELLDRFASHARVILDAGCGTGGFLVAFGSRRDSMLAAGADLSLDALFLARSHAVRPLLAATVVQLPVASESIDIVVSNDVLQHLPPGADEQAVTEAFRVLKTEGFFCLRTNLGAPVAGGPLLHRRYSRQTLSDLVRKKGFSIRKHVVLHPLARLRDGLRRGHGPGHEHGHHGLALTLPPAPINTAIDLYTHAEDALVSRLPFPISFGDAQIVIAQKLPRPS